MENLKQQIEKLNDKSKYREAAELAANTLGIKIKKDWLKYDYYFVGDQSKRHIFKIKLSKNGRSFSFNFGQSLQEDKNEPTTYSILCGLQKYDCGTFENFCSAFGYDEDSMKAKKIYEQVCEQFTNMQKLFNDQELETLSLIQ